MASEQPNTKQSRRAGGGRVDLSQFAGKISGIGQGDAAAPVVQQPAAPPAEPAAPPQRDPEPAPAPAQATAPADAPDALAEAPRRQQPARRPRERAAAQQEPSRDVSLAHALASQPATVDGQPPRSLSVQDMLSMRRKRVDPMNDFTADGTRMLTWVQDAVKLASDLTGYKQQEILRDALIGTAPLAAELLDEAFANRYGYPRPREMR